MFNGISKVYDRTNRLLSFGQDLSWRKKMARYLPEQEAMRYLDLATGTLDQLIAIMDKSHNIDEVFGLDPAEKMLEIGREKLKEKFYREKVSLQVGSAESIPFEDDFFDLVTISFGIRNVEDLPLSLNEVCRIIKPGGRFLILEFSLPTQKWIRKAHLFYLNHLLPHLAKLSAKTEGPYEYLSKTIQSFPYGEQFITILEEAGFSDVKVHPLFFGAVSIYQADKL